MTKKQLRKETISVMIVKTIIFDIDNTLYSYDDAHKAAFARLLEYAQRELGLSAEEFQTLHRQANEALKQRMGSVAAIHNRLIRYQNLLEKLGKPIRHALAMNDLYWNTLLDAARPSPGAAETLTELKRRGYRIGVGTDMTARLQFVKLERLSLLQCVDFLVSSEEACAEKPDPELFRLCVEKAGVSPEECLFVGDNLRKDVLGATACGLQSLWFRPGGGEAEPGVGQIRALPELLEVLA